MRNTNSLKSVDQEYLVKQVSVFEQCLEGFGLQIRVVEVKLKGRSTVFLAELALGTRIADILILEKDIALALASPSGTVLISAPVPGRSLIGIEVPLPTGTLTNDDKGKKLKITNEGRMPFLHKRFVDALADVFDFFSLLTFRIASTLRKS